MGFVGSLFNSSQGAGFSAAANQGSGIGASSAQQAGVTQGVENQMQNIAQNGSPLAQAQLQEATNQNIANQAGLVSSQKGLNPALAARQAGMNAGQIGQQAANQSAQLQAQTQMAAQQNLANTSLQQQGVYQGALANQNNAQAGLANTIAKGQQGMFGGALGSIGLSGFQNSAHGGMIGYADGGQVGSSSFGSQFLSNGNPSNVPAQPFNNPMPMSSGIKPVPQVQPQAQSLSGDQQLQKGTQQFGSAIKGGLAGLFAAAHGGKVPAMVSPGEVYIPPSKVTEVAKGKDPKSVGEQIPGTPKVKGDSYANDTVPKKLTKGGVVIPNSVMQSKDPAAQAAKFVAAILAKQGGAHAFRKSG